MGPLQTRARYNEATNDVSTRCHSMPERESPILEFVPMLTFSSLRIPLIAALFVAAPSIANAQSAKDAVRDHVDKNLDSKKDKRRDGQRNSGRANSGRSSSRRSSTAAEDGTPITLDMTDPELANPTGPKLPIRLFPGVSNLLRLNLKLDTAYRGWLPQQYESTDVDIASYLTWSVAVKGKFFKYITLQQGSYESNGLSSPRNRRASVAAQVGKHSPKAAKALAFIGFPALKTFQPIIRYEARAFSTTASPNIPVCIVDYEDSADLENCPREQRALEMVSSFETLVAGINYISKTPSHSFAATPKGKLPPMYLGLGLLSYRKPYQVTIDGDTLEEFLFDGHFRGAGLAFGGEFGGGAKRFFAKADVQVGLGEVGLTRDFDLSEVTPEDWLLGYVQGNVHAGYRFVVFEGAPTVYFRPSVSAGGASFHFVNTSGEADSAPTVNWDFLWAARAALEVAL